MLLVVLVIIQTPLAIGFVLFLWRAKPIGNDFSFCPKTAILLPLRGADPFLEHCIASVLQQDHPNYDVRIVIDSRDDPAWKVVHAVVERLGATHVRIEVLHKIRDTCTLKISGLLQLIEQLDESYEVVVLVDADMVAQPMWLRQLIAPMVDSRVGTTSGNRWFMPNDPSWGAIMRYLWNSASVVQMLINGFPWAGSLATRAHLLRKPEVIESLKHAFGDDSVLGLAAVQHGLTMVHVPELMMINRETCSVRGFMEFSFRQLLTVRLNHSRFPMVMLHGFATSAALGATTIVMLLALISRNALALELSVGGLWVYLVGMLLSLMALEAAVRRSVRLRGEPVDWITLATVAKIVLAIFPTQAIYTVTLIKSITAKGFRWRGVDYKIGPGKQLHMLGYRPYRPANAETAEHPQASL